MTPTYTLSDPYNTAAASSSLSTTYMSGYGGDMIANHSPLRDGGYGRNGWHDRRLSPSTPGGDARRSGVSNGETETIIHWQEGYRSPSSPAGSQDLVHAMPLVINCGGYRLSDVLLPTLEYEDTRRMLKNQVNPFEDLSSVKITIYSDQEGRSFKPRQLRIRSGRGSRPYTLDHVVELLVKSLVKGPDATVDYSHLPHWYLDTIVREARDTTFRCCFKDCGGSKWEEAQRTGLAQFAARHDTWGKKS